MLDPHKDIFVFFLDEYIERPQWGLHSHLREALAPWNIKPYIEEGIHPKKKKIKRLQTLQGNINMQITIILLVEDLITDDGLQKCQGETLESLVP